jgi:hypothetical protein
MERRVFSLVLICVCAAQLGFSQTLTKEKRRSVERKEGDTTITEAVVVSETEDISRRNQTIVVNPLKFLLFYNLSYFHTLSPSVTIGGGVQFPTPKDLYGYGLSAEVRFFPSGRSPRGFYLAPNVAYNKLWSDEGETEPFSVGVLFGWQWFPGTDFAMGMGIGVDYYSGTIREGHAEFHDYDGWVPALRFDIGYAW